MTVAEKIINYIKIMPESTQIRVLDYIEYLELKKESIDKERNEWSNLSLSQAMRGMESEPSIYSESDIKEPVG